MKAAMDNPKIYNKNTDVVPDDAVLVDRSSKYGNPYRLGIDGNFEQVKRLYIDYLIANPKLVEDIKTTLRGKDLICWCVPDKCHAELILKLANDPYFELSSLL